MKIGRWKSLNLRQTVKLVLGLQDLKEGYIDLAFRSPTDGEIATFRAGKDEQGFYAYTFRAGYWKGQRVYYDDVESLVKAVKANKARAVFSHYDVVRE